MFRATLVFVALLAAAMGTPSARAAVVAAPAGCVRPAAGSVAKPPPELFSKNGQLTLRLNYMTSTDKDGRALFCFVTPDGMESPTLHVKPGDVLNITLYNTVPDSPSTAGQMKMMLTFKACGALMMNASSVNMHFHGTNTPPTCHEDEVINTLVNSGQQFDYHLQIPPDEPAGLYWYHPHVHGQSEGALLGGASGALIVDGIEKDQPSVIGLPSRVLVVRDQIVAGNLTPGGAIPAWDISLNYVPVSYPANTPAIIVTPNGRKEFWRVLNGSADTVADIVVKYDGVNQPLQVVGLDGVPTGSQDGLTTGTPVTKHHILIPPAGRAEFIIAGPAASVGKAVLETRAIDTGPYGDNDTTRVLAVIQRAPPVVKGLAAAAVADDATFMPGVGGTPGPKRFAGLMSAPVSARRKLYFSEVLSNPSDPASPTNFFITVDGATPTLFDGSNPPAITTTQGAVEEWTIENRAQEVHEFHIHQIHFKLLEVNGKPVPAGEQQFLDTVQVPYWDGVSAKYPSVKVRLDFRGNITGDFVYHCHILGHEDAGMMAIIRVVPRPGHG